MDVSPASEWYPTIRLAFIGHPALAHQDTQVAFTEWLVYRAASSTGTPQRIKLSRKWILISSVAICCHDMNVLSEPTVHMRKESGPVCWPQLARASSKDFAYYSSHNPHE